jgi:chromosomal replication initiator protein
MPFACKVVKLIQKMVKDHTTVWDSCLQVIRDKVPIQSFKTWFEPIRPVKLDQDALTIQVPNHFFYEWLEEHYVNLLKSSIRKELGANGRLQYQILMDQPLGKKKKEDENSELGKSYTDLEIKNPFVIPGIKRLKIDSQLDPKYDFENLIEGDCNRLARSAGIAISDKPGLTSFNPLIIFGDTGLGKTHLAQAIGNACLKKHPGKTVLYVSSDKFTNQIIDSIKNNTINDFVNFYQLIDVLIVDDIQFLQNKQKTQEIFFNIFNQLHQNKKQVVLTSDKAPKDLSGMQERLISRFKWGLSADLQSPDFETRMAILEHKLEFEGIHIPKEVSEFIAYNITSNIREMEGVVNGLIAQSSLNQKEIDMELARMVIKNLVSEVNREITIEYIQKSVADFYKLQPEKLTGKTRKRDAVIARQVAMYLCKLMTDKSLKVIGDEFGGRDHSTVIYSCNSTLEMIDSDHGFREKVDEIEKKIKISLGAL